MPSNPNARSHTLYVLVALAALTLCPQVAAQGAPPVPCGPRVEIVQNLEGKYDEKQIFAGLTHGGVIIEVFGGERGWTILISKPDGESCMVGTGEAYAGQRRSS